MYKSYDELTNQQKELFESDKEYFTFLSDVIKPNLYSKKSYIVEHKNKIEEINFWVEKYYKFYNKYPSGCYYFFEGQKFRIRPEFLAFFNVRLRMLNKRKKELNLDKISQSDSNHLTRRAKVSYLVFMEILTIQDNILFENTVPKKIISLNKANEMFDYKFVLGKGLSYPREYGYLDMHLLDNVMGYNKQMLEIFNNKERKTNELFT